MQFDVSVWEFFWPFIAGAKLVMLNRKRTATRSLCSNSLPNMVNDHALCAVDAGSICCIADAETARQNCATLKQVFCSGEALRLIYAANGNS